VTDPRVTRQPASHSGSTDAAAASVIVAVTTYRRPDGLERLLRSLDRLCFVEQPPSDLRILVVDNDSARSAEGLCARLVPHARWPIEYRCEPRRGIAQARNHALAMATARADFTAFVDDDEFVEPTWLDELLAVAGCYGADVVFGPVLPCFQSEAPAWVQKGRFFERPRRDTGTRMAHGYTGNCLLRSARVAGAGISFADRFGLSGGEDTHFFLRLNQAGLDMRWANGAVAHEIVPPSRVHARWILRRAFRVGCTWSLSERAVLPSPVTRVKRIAKGIARCLQGIAMLVVAPARGWHAIVRAAQVACTGAGNIAGAFGFAPEIYR
jgi:succinoglycan biosynthesis protein ExoM